MVHSSNGKTLYYQLVDILKKQIESNMIPHENFLLKENWKRSMGSAGLPYALPCKN